MTAPAKLLLFFAVVGGVFAFAGWAGVGGLLVGLLTALWLYLDDPEA